ncbi:MAG: ATP synthase F1 subunit delta [Rikenellaceae bacterium]|jgi:F-type H+-transporting ATPase subunit delta|nr:ATP synthase F1 subunit delta [Rikenellaceae bacterium]
MIAQRYARALFEFARAQGADREIYENMTCLLGCYAAVENFSSSLDSPVLGRGVKLSLVCEASGAKGECAFRQFAKLVMRNRREGYFRAIAHHYLRIFRAHYGVMLARLTVARESDADIKERLVPLVKREEWVRTVEFDLTVDSAIGGGFILEFDTWRLDASLATQLRRVARGFGERNRTT